MFKQPVVLWAPALESNSNQQPDAPRFTGLPIQTQAFQHEGLSHPSKLSSLICTCGNPGSLGLTSFQLCLLIDKRHFTCFLESVELFLAKPGLCYCWPWPHTTTATSRLLELEFGPSWLSHSAPSASRAGIPLPPQRGHLPIHAGQRWSWEVTRRAFLPSLLFSIRKGSPSQQVALALGI